MMKYKYHSQNWSRILYSRTFENKITENMKIKMTKTEARKIHEILLKQEKIVGENIFKSITENRLIPNSVLKQLTQSI